MEEGFDVGIEHYKVIKKDVMEIGLIIKSMDKSIIKKDAYLLSETKLFLKSNVANKFLGSKKWYKDLKRELQLS